MLGPFFFFCDLEEYPGPGPSFFYFFNLSYFSFEKYKSFQNLSKLT
jgi:hypothetical protein